MGKSVFGSRIADERRSRGWSQKELGEKLGIGRSAVAMLETDKAPLYADRLVRLGADGFDVLYILSGERAAVAAGRMIDWDLCLDVIEKVRAWQAKRKIRLSRENFAIVVKQLYLRLAQRAEGSDVALDEIFREAA